MKLLLRRIGNSWWKVATDPEPWPWRLAFTILLVIQLPVMLAAGIAAALIGWPNPYIAMSLAGGAVVLTATWKVARGG